ncbi:hypothetical protein [Halovulum sp. GXIMD14793]
MTDPIALALDRLQALAETRADRALAASAHREHTRRRMQQTQTRQRFLKLARGIHEAVMEDEGRGIEMADRRACSPFTHCESEGRRVPVGSAPQMKG